MAHPLTQHPPNMIGFGAPATMSPLSFGFGQPGMALGSPVRPGAFNGLHHGFGAMSPGFASPGFASAGPSSPFKRGSPPRTSSMPIPTLSHKRSRRASSVSSSSSPVGSPSFSSRRIDDDDRRERKLAGSKAIKRIRKEAADESTNASDGPDLGLLLASLPPTSHLPILMDIIHEDPSLAPRILRRIPQPPLDNCLEQLERIVSKVGRAAGSWDVQEGYVASRRWNRVEELVDNFTKTASTYLKFFSQPTSTQEPVEPNTLYHLLHALTAHALQIMPIVPDGPPTSARPFLELANLILTSWGTWLTRISDEVNNRGGMFPQSMAQSWADGLDHLAREPQQVTHAAAPTVSWAMPMSMPPPPSTRVNPLVPGFRHALQPIRDRFMNELGWLAARG